MCRALSVCSLVQTLTLGAFRVFCPCVRSTRGARQIPLPPPELDVPLAEYARICCALLDIPVHTNVIESLHVMFSLYSEFKDQQQYAGVSSLQ